MGYTHYQYHTQPFEDAEWTQVVDAIACLVDQAEKEGLKLSIDNGETPLSNHQRIERAWLSECRNGPAIMLNGMGEDAHETFCLFKNGAPNFDGEVTNGFEFCKTAMKPYDRFVVAALAWVETKFPGRLNVSSDGDPDDWQTGMDFAARAFPDEEIQLPPKVRNYDDE